MEGAFDLVLMLACVCCLTEFQLPLAARFRYILCPQSNGNFASEKELEQGTGDLEVAYYQGERIDLRPLVREQIYLALPQNPHCKDNCLGLCPQCGVNLNEESCACTLSSKESSPFAVLKKFKKTSRP